MVWRAMGDRWTSYLTQSSYFVLFILVFEIQSCRSLNSEGLTLLQFRANVDFDPFGALANWNPNDSDPCIWSGVDCHDGKVHMLYLSGQDLVGALAPELGNLSHLRVLDLSKNHFYGTIPSQFGWLRTLELLDLRDNYLTGTIPAQLGGLYSLKRLLLGNNRFKGSIPVEIGKLSLLTDVQFDAVLTTPTARNGCMNRKFGYFVWKNVPTQSKKSCSFRTPNTRSIICFLNLFPRFKFEHRESLKHTYKSHAYLTDLTEQGVNQVNNVRRILAAQSTNMEAIPSKAEAPSQSDPVNVLPSKSSGSFPAVPNEKKSSPPPPVPSPNPSAVSQPTEKQSSAGKMSGSTLKLIIGIPSAVFLLIIIAIILIIFRRRAVKTIVPWKSGLSGQLQRAFVTGVPKLNRAELETACEDFSNIIITHDGVSTMYKGTLSSGVEIVVASTAIQSSKDWSKQAEFVFRRKVDTLSRVNHKNFVNLIGYCDEDEPFTRMMVFEYAPNGTLSEHLHIKEVEHLDWNARMRIIMGIAYCLEHMHDLDPPVVHFSLNSKEIFLTDDYAAKIGDIGFWAELIAKSKLKAENELQHPDIRVASNVETNIYSFGIMLLEIISGKHTYTDQNGHLLIWANQYLNDKKTIVNLIDPSLNSFKDNELDAVCEAIQYCVRQDIEDRPTMKEVIMILRHGIDIAPESATPRLSALWWAELEILSAEAA